MNTLKGLMFGSCLADAIGLTREFKGPCKIENIKFPYKYDLREWKANDFSDDTDQMILLLELMIEKNLTQRTFAKKLFDWKNNGFPEIGDTVGCGIGGSTLNVINDGMFLVSPQQSAEYFWNGSGCSVSANGALMRCAILSFTHNYLKVSEDICKVTHADPRCVASCLTLTHGIRSIMFKKFKNIKKNSIAPGLKYLTKQTCCPTTDIRGVPNNWVNKKYLYKNGVRGKVQYDYAQELLEVTAKSSDLKNLELNPDRGIGIGYTYKCLGCALFAMDQVEKYNSRNEQLPYERLIKQIASFGGDADTNCIVAGAVFGAYLGFKELYKQVGHMIDAMPHSSWLMGKINVLDN